MFFPHIAERMLRVALVRDCGSRQKYAEVRLIRAARDRFLWDRAGPFTTRECVAVAALVQSQSGHRENAILCWPIASPTLTGLNDTSRYVVASIKSADCREKRFT